MQSRRLFGVLAALVVSLSVNLAAVRAQEPETPSVDPAARAAFEAGRDAYQAGRFADALRQFDRAYAISSHPVLLYNIGRAAEADQQTDRAIQAYESYLVALQRAENREFVEARLAKLRQAPAPSIPSATSPASAPLAEPAPEPIAAAAPLPPVLPPPIAEEPRRNRWRIYAGAHVGVGGKAENDAFTADLNPTFGGQLGAALVWKYFGIGAELRLSSLGYVERVSVLDIVIKPRVGMRLDRIPLEFYAALPIGGSPYANFPTSDAVEYDVGFTVGGSVGATYFFSQHVGINAELGVTWHEFDYKSESYNGMRSFTETEQLKLWQVRPLTANLVVAL